MGLGQVELILALEEKFNVSFDDESLEHIRTVDDLTTFLQLRVPKVPPALPPPCITSIAFFRLRAAITAVALEKRSRFHPATKFGDVFSPEETRRLWPRIKELSRLRLPNLVRRKRDVLLAALVVAAITACAAYCLAWPVTRLPDDHLPIATFFFPFLLAPAWWFAARLTRPWKAYPETRPATIGVWVRDIAERNVGPLRCELGVPFTREEIFQIVRRELVLACGCDEDEVRPEARLVQDLGME